jgi:hypothetical protein
MSATSWPDDEISPESPLPSPEMPSFGQRFRIADLSAELFDGGFIVLPEPRHRIDERLTPASPHVFTLLRRLPLADGGCLLSPLP